jgi:hypothetical protein
MRGKSVYFRKLQNRVESARGAATKGFRAFSTLPCSRAQEENFRSEREKRHRETVIPDHEIVLAHAYCKEILAALRNYREVGLEGPATAATPEK